MVAHKKIESGFTLIELVIVIAIIGILAAVAAPQYAKYTKISKFTNVVSVTVEHKSAVQLCVQDLNTLSGCSSGLNGVPPAITLASGYIKSLTVLDGLVTATATQLLDERQYILEASYAPLTNTTTWVVSGSCLSAGLCRK